MGVTRRYGGVTLVELMLVVAIIGILAATAIPAFSRYVRKSKTAEAPLLLNKLWASSVSYYETDHLNSAQMVVAKQFAGPNATCYGNAGGVACGCLVGSRCKGADPGWDSDPVWKAMAFSLPDPFNYCPWYASTGTGTSALFTSMAWGDLDCDSTQAQFMRRGSINNLGDVTGNSAPFVAFETE